VYLKTALLLNNFRDKGTVGNMERYSRNVIYTVRYYL